MTKLLLATRNAGKLAELMVGDGAAGAVDDHQPGGFSRLGRMLRDESVREVEIEIGREQPHRSYALRKRRGRPVPDHSLE